MPGQEALAREIVARLSTGNASSVEVFTAFEELDWAGVTTEIAQLTDERSRLESASDVLKQLNENLRGLQRAHKETGTELQSAREKRARAEQRRADAQDLHQQTESLLAGAVVDEALAETLEAMRAEALGEHPVSYTHLTLPTNREV